MLARDVFETSGTGSLEVQEPLAEPTFNSTQHNSEKESAKTIGIKPQVENAVQQSGDEVWIDAFVWNLRYVGKWLHFNIIYSTQLSKYDPFKAMDGRKKRIRYECQRSLGSIENQIEFVTNKTDLLMQFIVNDERQIVYCFVPKIKT